MVAEGSIHGRFQPFHNEHLEYALTALDHCSFLWIGLTEPFPDSPTLEGPAHRLGTTANPLTYHERQFMITRTLVAEGVSPEHFTFTPFPIRSPELLPHYLDPEITCFTTINDDWNQKKVDALNTAGYPVEILWERKKKMESSTIRSLLLENDDRWRDLVPSSVASFLDEIDLPSRLRDLQDR